MIIVEEGCLISVTALVDHDVVVERYSHINAGAICKAGSRIESGVRIESAVVVKGY